MKTETKAVIWQSDHQNDVVVINKKNRIGDTFSHRDAVYFLDDTSFQLTEGRKRGQKRIYVTYYYVEGIPKPIPPDKVKPGLVAVDENGKRAANRPLPVPDFKGIPNLGVPPEELKAIFTPFFYRIIAATSEDTWKKIQFWTTIGTGLVALYCAWQITTVGQSVSEMRTVIDGLVAQNALHG